MEHLTAALWAILPAVFSAGGVYALFRWRLDRVEKVVEKLADNCVANRSKCLVDFSTKITASEKSQEHHWEMLDKKLSRIDNFMGRVEQYMRMKNGIHYTDAGDNNE